MLHGSSALDPPDYSAPRPFRHRRDGAVSQQSHASSRRSPAREDWAYRRWPRIGPATPRQPGSTPRSDSRPPAAPRARAPLRRWSSPPGVRATRRGRERPRPARAACPGGRIDPPRGAGACAHDARQRPGTPTTPPEDRPLHSTAPSALSCPPLRFSGRAIAAFQVPSSRRLIQSAAHFPYLARVHRLRARRSAGRPGRRSG